MASRQGSRKRQRIASSIDTTAGDESAVAAPRTASLPTTTMPAPINPPAAQHEQALKTLNSDIDAMRSLLTCKVCNRLLYEPFSLSCGHAYCYSCLSQWMVDHNKKTCPDCRAHIFQEPTPAYIVRELVLLFASRAQLLPPGESVEEHQKFASDEAKIVADARADTDPLSGGLFQGVFAYRHRRPHALYDPGDDVYRCPNCHHEVEDGHCIQCDEDVDFSDEDDDDFDAGHELDILDHEAYSDLADDYEHDDDFHSDAGAVAHGPAARNRSGRVHRHHWSDESDCDDDQDADDVGNLRDFVVNDDGPIPVEDVSSDSEATDVPRFVSARSVANRRGRTVVISDDEDDDEDDGDTMRSTATGQRTTDYDSTENTPVPSAPRLIRGQGAPLPVHAQFSVTDSESESDVSSVVYRGHNDLHSRQYRPLHHGHANLHDEGDDEDDDDDDDNLSSEFERTYHGEFSPPRSTDDASSMRSDYESEISSFANPTYDDYNEFEDEDEVSDSDEDGWDLDHNPQAHNYALNAPATYPSRPGYAGPATLPGRSGYAGYSTMGAAGPMPWMPYGVPMAMPLHPFNLENTLARASYSQRNLHARPSYMDRGYASTHAESSNARKRALSIDSDDSQFTFG